LLTVTHLTSKQVQNHKPKGVYLIPIPTNLYYSGISSQQGSPVKVSGRGNKPGKKLTKDGHESLVAALNEYALTIPPWQGVKFIRNPHSLFYQGVFRFEILFVKKKYLAEWVEWDSSNNETSLSAESVSYINPYYPILKLNSEIHSVGNHHERIAEYCLEGIEQSEKDHKGYDPFSRVLYVLDRLDQWFNRQDHEPQMAAMDVQLSRDDTHLYHTVKHDGTESQPEGSRLISFASMELDEKKELMTILDYMRKQNTE
jgi:hypothetical protein